MCELLAMSANVPTDICFSFSGLMQRGGNTGPHKDGWGITFYEGKGCRNFKDPLPSANSPIAKLVTEYPIKSELVICHIRQANSGGICLENTHPFIRPISGKNWTYAHNGQLADFHNKLPIKNNFPIGTTDSEHAYCWILDQIEMHQHAKVGEFCLRDLAPFIGKLCSEVNKLGVFNLLLSDGDYLFSYCANNLHYITRRAPFGKASLIDAEMVVDFQQETTENDVVTVIATQPLTDDENWHKYSAGQWFVFNAGEVVMQGQEHVG